MVKLGVILLVKLIVTHWRQRMTTGTLRALRQKVDEIDPCSMVESGHLKVETLF
jgi:hypothetical protein